MKLSLQYFTLLLLSFGACGRGLIYAQLPVCTGPGSSIIYSVYANSTSIYNYDPSLPISSANPSLNSISLPANALSNGPVLAVSDNLNGTGPSPTFYTIVDSGASRYYAYYNGSSWVNTGHVVNGIGIGAGGSFIYSMAAGGGTSINIYKYNGTGNASFLVNIPTPNSSWEVDIAVDCAGDFYILWAYNIGAWLHEYNSNGVLVNSWTASGFSLGNEGHALAIIGNQVYCIYETVGSSAVWHLYSGIISGSNINFSIVTSALGNPSNFASCAFGNNIATANTDTAFYNCMSPDTLIASGIGPFTWSVLNGPAIISGSGDTVSVSATANSRIVLSTGAFAPCGNTDTVTIIPVLGAMTLNSNSPVCTGYSLQLTVSSLQPGLSWQWHGPNNFIDTTYNPVISPIQISDSGYYTVRDSLNGCTAFDSIFVSTIQGPLIPQPMHNTPCAGDTLQLTVNNVQSTVNFSWNGPGFSSSQQSPFIANAQSSNVGIYTLTAWLNGCSMDSAIMVTVNPTVGPPIINISVSPNDTICAGDNATLSATTNAGSPVYAWKKNGLNFGPNSVSFTTGGLANGDIIICEVNSNTPCQPVDTALSNAIAMQVLLLSPPSVYITKYPAVYTSGDTVTFMGHPSSSTGITYQWMKNGAKIIGATSANYTTTNVNAGDSICLIIYSHVHCTEPDSNIACKELTTSINNFQPLISNILTYPTPLTNQLIIEGAEQGTIVSISNIIGQAVYTGVIRDEKEIIDTKDLTKGIYLLQLSSINGIRELRKVVKQ